MKSQQLTTLFAVLAGSAAASNGASNLVCDMARIEPKPHPERCGVKVSPTNLNRMIENPSVASQDRCARACYHHTKCESFTWEDSSKVCRLFDTTAKNMYIRPSMDGLTEYWNKDCWECKTRTFYLTAASANTELYNAHNILVAPSATEGATYSVAGFESELTTYTLFNMYNNGVLTLADGKGVDSYEAFKPRRGTSPIHNREFSTVLFMSESDATASSRHVPVHCTMASATSTTYDVTCWSDAGSSFYGCHDHKNPDSDASGLMLSQMGMTQDNGSLHSKNCHPVTLTAVTV